MSNVVVIGTQWGDEGKGKIVDWLSERADVVARFQGGHNAGHTLVIDGVSYKLSLLPSGVVREGKMSVIGNGVVFDPHAFVAELGRLAQQGVTNDEPTDAAQTIDSDANRRHCARTIGQPGPGRQPAALAAARDRGHTSAPVASRLRG